MRYSVGNDKLGKGCLVTSRAVGDTCPDTCDYLHNGCYAEATEKRFPNARNLGLHNLIQPWNLIRAMLLKAVKDGRSVRFHERGDFLINGELDITYLNSIKTAIDSIITDGHKLPDIWVYTHVYDSRILEILSGHVSIYASVHNAKQLREAKKAGFKLFAFCDTENKLLPNHKRKQVAADIPKYITFDKKRFLVCPEQRMGREKVTCTGSNNVACNYCVRGIGNVAFINH